MPSVVRVRAPASTANLGSAFDAGAIALGLHNEVAAAPAERDSLEVVGEGAAALEAGAPNLVLRACDALCERAGRPRPPLALRLENGIPLGRGLGSSAAAIAAGLRLGEALCGLALPEAELLALAAALEGHADNTTAALLGGCTVAVADGSGVTALRLPLPDGLRVVVFVPNYAVSTETARAALPERVPRADAVFNAGRAALLAAALATGRLEALAVAMQDRLHQPYRLPLYQAMQPLLEAARAAGAYGGAVSGAGPRVAALSPAASAEAVAAALAEAARRHGVGGRPLVLRPDTAGARQVSLAG